MPIREKASKATCAETVRIDFDKSDWADVEKVGDAWKAFTSLGGFAANQMNMTKQCEHGPFAMSLKDSVFVGRDHSGTIVLRSIKGRGTSAF